MKKNDPRQLYFDFSDGPEPSVINSASSREQPLQAEDPPLPEDNGPNPLENSEINAGPSGDGPPENGDSSLLKDDEPSSLRKMIASHFMEYASYVIKDRAIPHINDGLKPVQRRILHSLWEMDDGKFHKVANVVGNTMKYHPHGDASIYNALVHIANKEYFIDKQGNFGNIYTGDVASAARYIECRLSALAKEILFNKEITEFVDSYDGRNKEPLTLPAKAPVLLMQGAEGIAVGMATKILSHNFQELLNAQIAILKNQNYQVYPDFYQGGIMDISNYDEGNGKIRLRAKIEPTDQKTLVIREIPASTTTESLMNSIEDAVNKGKLKIASLNDYTAESVEIEIGLPRGIYAEQTLKALFAYTDCEVSISTNCLLIVENRPKIVTVREILEHNTEKLVDDLRRELEIELGKLEDQFHAKTLAQIFIENRIYKRIESCKTYELVIQEVDKGLQRFNSQFKREVTRDDIEKLLQIPIRRISQFDIDKNKKDLDDILIKIDEVHSSLANIQKFTITYLKNLLKKYGDRYPRRTQIDNLETVNVREVALSNVKVGWDRSNGYVGTAVKLGDMLVCTEYDRIIVLNWDGTYKVMAIPEKLYVGSVCSVMKSDKNQVYSMVYRDKKSRISYAKRFRISQYILDREYKTTPPGCKVDRLFDRHSVILRCEFEAMKRQKVNHCEVDFDQIQTRGASAKGYKIADKKIVKYLKIKRGNETQPTPDAEQSDIEL